jgi:hypothetical protein
MNISRAEIKYLDGLAFQSTQQWFGGVGPLGVLCLTISYMTGLEKIAS